MEDDVEDLSGGLAGLLLIVLSWMDPWAVGSTSLGSPLTSEQPHCLMTAIHLAELATSVANVYEPFHYQGMKWMNF